MEDFGNLSELSVYRDSNAYTTRLPWWKEQSAVKYCFFLGSQPNKRSNSNDCSDPIHSATSSKSNFPDGVKTQAKLCMLNAQSIRNKATEFVYLVVDNKYDIVAITEIWLKPGDDVVIGDITSAGYSFDHVPRPGIKIGGGVGLLYKSNLSVKIIKKVESLYVFWVSSLWDHL